MRDIVNVPVPVPALVKIGEERVVVVPVEEGRIEELSKAAALVMGGSADCSGRKSGSGEGVMMLVAAVVTASAVETRGEVVEEEVEEEEEEEEVEKEEEEVEKEEEEEETVEKEDGASSGSSFDRSPTTGMPNFLNTKRNSSVSTFL